MNYALLIFIFVHDIFKIGRSLRTLLVARNPNADPYSKSAYVRSLSTIPEHEQGVVPMYDEDDDVPIQDLSARTMRTDETKSYSS